MILAFITKMKAPVGSQMSTRPSGPRRDVLGCTFAVIWPQDNTQGED